MAQIPQALLNLFSHFPLYTHPDPIFKPKVVQRPTLWIVKPHANGTASPRTSASTPSAPDVLSSDVECLKWQSYVALRGLKNIALRWDVSPDGAMDGRLPNLQLTTERGEGEKPDRDLLPAHRIPEWVDARVGGGQDALEGYRDEASKDESHAWVSLLEGDVHAALVLAQPQPSVLSFLSPGHEINAPRPIETLLSPPPAPLFGHGSIVPEASTSLFPPIIFPLYGTSSKPVHVNIAAVEQQYRDAVASLSERLGSDKWFLGSSTPTALDALVFAYLHSILHARGSAAARKTQTEVNKRVNLIAWERRVRTMVQQAFE